MGDGRNRTACLGNGVKNVKRIEQPENAITVKSIRFLYKEISGFAVTVMCCSSCFRMVLKESASVGKLLRKCNEQKRLRKLCKIFSFYNGEDLYCGIPVYDVV